MDQQAAPSPLRHQKHIGVPEPFVVFCEPFPVMGNAHQDEDPQVLVIQVVAKWKNLWVWPDIGWFFVEGMGCGHRFSPYQTR